MIEGKDKEVIKTKAENLAKLIEKKLKEYKLENVNELKNYIIKDFETCLDMSKDDIFYYLFLIWFL